MKSRLLDMHAHLACLSDEYVGALPTERKFDLGRQELNLRAKCDLLTVFSCGTPREWEFMQRCSGDFLLSFGIHPWYSNRYRPQDYREYFRECAIVGEIGMDSVWCEVPLSVQRNVFEQQLEIAAELKKSVILHTKGQEAQIAEMIRDFPEQACVHWYSGDEDAFEQFLESGCYFTIGPDFADICLAQEETLQKEEKEKAVLYRRMIREIPAGRLLLETDGVSSIAWARNMEHVSLEEISAVLEQNLIYMAEQKQIPLEQLRNLIWENFNEYLSAQSAIL